MGRPLCPKCGTDEDSVGEGRVWWAAPGCSKCGGVFCYVCKAPRDGLYCAHKPDCGSPSPAVLLDKTLEALGAFVGVSAFASNPIEVDQASFVAKDIEEQWDAFYLDSEGPTAPTSWWTGVLKDGRCFIVAAADPSYVIQKSRSTIAIVTSLLNVFRETERNLREAEMRDFHPIAEGTNNRYVYVHDATRIRGYAFDQVLYVEPLPADVAEIRMLIRANESRPSRRVPGIPGLARDGRSTLNPKRAKAPHEIGAIVVASRPIELWKALPAPMQEHFHGLRAKMKEW